MLKEWKQKNREANSTESETSVFSNWDEQMLELERENKLLNQ